MKSFQQAAERNCMSWRNLFVGDENVRRKPVRSKKIGQSRTHFILTRLNFRFGELAKSFASVIWKEGKG